MDPTIRAGALEFLRGLVWRITLLMPPLRGGILVIRRAPRCGFALVFAACMLFSPALHAGGNDRVRPYVDLRAGTMFYLNGGSVPGAQIETPAFTATGSRIPTFGLTLGMDLSRYWGVEFAADYAKTEMTAHGVGSLGDFWSLTGAAHLRLRYPLGDGDFVPYAIAGGGAGAGGFANGKNFTYPIGGRGESGFGDIGGGVDYFIVPNIAIGLETRYRYLFRPAITLNHQPQTLDADSLTLAADLRVYFDHLASGSAAPVNLAPAQDEDKFRVYAALRGGKGLFMDPNHLSAVRIDSLSGALISAAFGANFDRHFGAEADFEYTRSQLRSPTQAEITGYPLWTILGLMRVRQPMFEDRFSPYVVLGGGLGFGETGDPDMPLIQSGFSSRQNQTPVAATGVGFDYFIDHNVALNLETRDTFLFTNKIGLNGQPMSLNSSFISFTGGLRFFFN